MTSIHETVNQKESLQPNPTPLEKTQIQGFLSVYHNQSDNFQDQIEKSVTNRCQLFGNAYTEYVKLCKNLVDTIMDTQNEHLAQVGLRIDYPEAYENMFNKYCETAQAWYYNQTRAIESILDMTAQNLKLVNKNMTGFSDLILTNYLWWIPPFKNN